MSISVLLPNAPTQASTNPASLNPQRQVLPPLASIPANTAPHFLSASFPPGSALPFTSTSSLRTDRFCGFVKNNNNNNNICIYIRIDPRCFLLNPSPGPWSVTTASQGPAGPGLPAIRTHFECGLGGAQAGERAEKVTGRGARARRAGGRREGTVRTRSASLPVTTCSYGVPDQGD